MWLSTLGVGRAKKKVKIIVMHLPASQKVVTPSKINGCHLATRGAYTYM